MLVRFQNKEESKVFLAKPENKDRFALHGGGEVDFYAMEKEGELTRDEYLLEEAIWGNVQWSPGTDAVFAVGPEGH